MFFCKFLVPTQILSFILFISKPQDVCTHQIKCCGDLQKFVKAVANFCRNFCDSVRVTSCMGVDHRVDRGTCPPTFWKGESNVFCPHFLREYLILYIYYITKFTAFCWLFIYIYLPFRDRESVFSGDITSYMCNNTCCCFLFIFQSGANLNIKPSYNVLFSSFFQGGEVWGGSMVPPLFCVGRRPWRHALRNDHATARDAQRDRFQL